MSLLIILSSCYAGILGGGGEKNEAMGLISWKIIKFVCYPSHLHLFSPSVEFKTQRLKHTHYDSSVTSPNCRVETEKGAGKLSALFYKLCCFWAQGGGWKEALHGEAGEGERGEKYYQEEVEAGGRVKEKSHLSSSFKVTESCTSCIDWQATVGYRRDWVWCTRISPPKSFGPAKMTIFSLLGSAHWGSMGTNHRATSSHHS